MSLSPKLESLKLKTQAHLESKKFFAILKKLAENEQQQLPEC